MPIEEHKEIVRRIPTQIFTEGNLDLIDEVFADGLVHHDPTGDLHSAEEFEAFVREFRTGFSDLEFHPVDLVGEKETVVLRYEGRGTHDGPFMGIEPTGREVTFSGVVIHRMEDETVVEAWHYPDALGVLQQLGAIPEELPPE